MDNYQGDLTDIVRASGGALTQSEAPLSNWEFPSDPIHLSSAPPVEDNRGSVFGDPFCNMGDPLLYQMNAVPPGYLISCSSSADNMLSTSCVDDSSNFRGASSSNILPHEVFSEEIRENTYNVFSRIQISPNNNNTNTNNPPVSPRDSPVLAAASPRGFKASAVVSGDMINANSSTSCLIENSGTLQISPPRNLGIKRRKSQAKKVVCIPAPAAANSRPSGEVVPSDLWAWRKYGQKPIKGSPYPRGYYRCSSSKGCSARKQVERSRTDPNMLVITYTSEHNHPWPTQRNALAGSTRSQPPKTNANSAAAASKTSPAASHSHSQFQSQKEEYRKDQRSSKDSLSVGPSTTGGGAAVKEEFEDIEKLQMEMNDHDQLSTEGLSQSYRPEMPESSQSHDFFADLGDIEPDPDLDLLFTQGFMGDHGNKESKNALDPFNIFDWSSLPGDGNNNNNSSTTSFGEAKRGL